LRRLADAIHQHGRILIARWPEHAAAADGLERRADMAMYAAKQRGSGCVVYQLEGLRGVAAAAGYTASTVAAQPIERPLRPGGLTSPVADGVGCSRRATT
jgi:hypothetical protein